MMVNDKDFNFYLPGGNDSFIYNGNGQDETIVFGPGEAGGFELRDTIGGVVWIRAELFTINKAITVNAGTGTDSVTWPGKDGELNNLRFVPSSTGAGQVIDDNGTRAPLTLTGTEQLNLVLLFADADGMRVDGTTGNHARTLT